MRRNEQRKKLRLESTLFLKFNSGGQTVEMAIFRKLKVTFFNADLCNCHFAMILHLAGEISRRFDWGPNHRCLCPEMH